MIHKKEAFYTAPKTAKHSQIRDIAPFLFSSHENIHTGESIQKCNESEELESIEQDIANLAQIKNIGKISDQFIFELDETEEQHLKQKSKFAEHTAGARSEYRNVFKNQPNQLRRYSKSPSADGKSISTSRGGGTTDGHNEEENKKKQMIMEYLKIVKNKISVMEKKLEEVTREAEYYKTKSVELEAARDRVIEKEKLMAMKYGIILSQNKELLSKLKKKKVENEELKHQLHEHQRKGSISELVSNDIYSKRLNNTIHNHKREDSSPMLKRGLPTSYSSSSFFNNCNPPEFEAVNKSGGNKAQDKSSDSDAIGATKNELMSQKTTYDDDEVLHSIAGGGVNELGLNFISPSQQMALNTFSNEQKAVVKSLINKLLWEQKQRFKSEDQNANSTEDSPLQP